MITNILTILTIPLLAAVAGYWIARYRYRNDFMAFHAFDASAPILKKRLSLVAGLLAIICLASLLSLIYKQSNDLPHANSELLFMTKAAPIFGFILGVQLFFYATKQR